MAAAVLLTGFEPFDGAARNESGDAVVAVGVTWADPAVRLVTAVLPVTFDGAATEVARLMAEQGPFDAVINVGLDSRAAAIKLERVAVNLADARIADNAGYQPIDQALDDDGAPAAYWSTLPLRSLAAGLAEAGLPVELSLSAGTFVCNATFYRVAALTAGTATVSGFVHVPPSPALPVERTAGALALIAQLVAAQTAAMDG